MKKMVFLFTFLLATTFLNAQWVFQPFDSAAATGWIDPNAFYASGQSQGAKQDFQDYYADKIEGTGSIKMDYNVVASEGWGGYTVRTSPSPMDEYLDLSAGTYLSFWYKVITPVSLSNTGQAFMEWKIGDYDADNKRDLWFHQPTALDLADASGEWHQILMPLARNDDKTIAFALQSGDGDQELQLDKIKSFEFAFVYITAGNPTNPPTASGTILFDKYQLIGNRYQPIFTFDNSASSWNIDDMSWAGPDGKGSVTLTNENTDKAEGEGALKFEYMCNASQDWGGFVSIDQEVAKPDSFENRTALVLYLKNLVPCSTSVPQRAMVRVFIFENSTGVNEEWIIRAPIDLTQASDWTRLYLPLVQKTMETDQDPPTDGFGPKSNNGDKTFNPEYINKIRIEIFAAGAGPNAGPKGEKLSGTILLDVMQQSGFQYSDKEPPVAPQNVVIIPGTYTNLVSWSDNTGENQEKYNIYFSKKPFSSPDEPGVEGLALGVSEGVQVWEHILRAPLNDKEYTFFYAVNCVDKAGNIGPLSAPISVTNTAKGVPIVSLKPPANFNADGNLSEWQNIIPFRLFLSDGTAFLAPNAVVDNDNDCSGTFYVALDQNYLYFAGEINDNIVYDNPDDYRDNSWTLDSPDLEFGLYNLKIPHTSYKRGSEPDYHLRFNKLMVREDHWDAETDSLLLPGPNYYWGERLFPSGYVIEAKVSLNDLAFKRDNPNAKTDTIYFLEGYKIPFDIGINDNDGLNDPERWRNREGLMFWTPTNQDAGWNNPSKLGYTWIGETDTVTDVNDDNILPFVYSLEQNYPNPFNPSTKIIYSLAKPGMVTLKVYNILGQQIADLVNEYQKEGQYTVNFNASKLASGVYFYKLESQSFVAIKKMIVIK